MGLFGLYLRRPVTWQVPVWHDSFTRHNSVRPKRHIIYAIRIQSVILYILSYIEPFEVLGPFEVLWRFHSKRHIVLGPSEVLWRFHPKRHIIPGPFEVLWRSYKASIQSVISYILSYIKDHSRRHKGMVHQIYDHQPKPPGLELVVFPLNNVEQCRYVIGTKTLG